MDIVSVAKARYSTKAFDPSKKLSGEQKHQLLGLLQHSPSSVNSQPWHFLVADTDAGKARIAKATMGNYQYNTAKIMDAAAVVVFCVKTKMEDDWLEMLLEQEQQDGRFIDSEAQAKQRKTRQFFVDLHRVERQDAEHWMARQVYLNLGNFLLGVATLGLDAIPLEGFDDALLNEEFQLQEQGLASLVIVSVGVRSDTDFNAKLPKSRLPQEKIISEF